LIGMETIPKLTAPFHIDRGMTHLPAYAHGSPKRALVRPASGSLPNRKQPMQVAIPTQNMSIVHRRGRARR
jgi:hypothetical protein